MRIYRIGKRKRDMHQSRAYMAENLAFGSHNHEAFMEALRVAKHPARVAWLKARIEKQNHGQPNDCGQKLSTAGALKAVGEILDAEQLPRYPVGFSRGNKAIAGGFRYNFKKNLVQHIELVRLRLQFAEHMLCGCLVAHEVAHLLETVRNSGQPFNMAHGPEWRAIYIELLETYFPAIDASKLAAQFTREFGDEAPMVAAAARRCDAPS